ARQVWIVCGPGNNGGDGLEASLHLCSPTRLVTVTWLGNDAQMPPDARRSLERARSAGVQFADAPATAMTEHDLCIDALLGIGLAPEIASRPPPEHWRALLRQLRTGPAPLLCIDVPSGLQTDTGAWTEGFTPDIAPQAPCHTLSLLTLKPGLFTSQGRDAAGTVWLDRLGAPPDEAHACVWLAGPPQDHPRAHASHKGSFGDVAIVGGEGLGQRGLGMEGAALLAASAALHAGAGRVLVALLDDGSFRAAQWAPELMQRRFEALDLPALSVVCGCGGGEAVANVLSTVLEQAARLVLDADALNAVARDAGLQTALTQRAARGLPTVLTPHPLEAARLLGSSTATVQSNRLAAARALADRFACVCVLKGSGSIVAAPGHLPCMNPTGNARLATAGTGDVLAGMVGARLATDTNPFEAVRDAVYAHGLLADRWPADAVLVASALARAQAPVFR
ncbi:MAG: NAD(P)H-hydrate dehydratase, partial [Giesbergeria sp.]